MFLDRDTNEILKGSFIMEHPLVFIRSSFIVDRKKSRDRSQFVFFCFFLIKITILFYLPSFSPNFRYFASIKKFSMIDRVSLRFNFVDDGETRALVSSPELLDRPSDTGGVEELGLSISVSSDS